MLLNVIYFILVPLTWFNKITPAFHCHPKQSSQLYFPPCHKAITMTTFVAPHLSGLYSRPFRHLPSRSPSLQPFEVGLLLWWLVAAQREQAVAIPSHLYTNLSATNGKQSIVQQLLHQSLITDNIKLQLLVMQVKHNRNLRFNKQ